MNKLLSTIFLLATMTVGTSHAQEAIPDFYRDPGINPNRSYVNQSFNEHIDPFTGSLQQHYVDVHLPGNGGFDLSVVRSYNSAAADVNNPNGNIYDFAAGVGWNIHFGRVLKPKDSSMCANLNTITMRDNPVLELPDGSRQLFAFKNDVSPTLMWTAQGWRADCLGALGSVTVYSPDGTRYDMTQLTNVGTALHPVNALSTSKITDKNGNYATISYRANTQEPEITTVTTSDGRTITFDYFDSGLATRRLKSITDGVGQTYTYDYVLVPNTAYVYLLSKVTRPGGTTWQYEYNGIFTNDLPGSYLMTKATNPEGGSISYGYGYVYFDAQSNPMSRSTVVKTKSRSAGASSAGGNWTFTYAPGSLSAYDRTTITNPNGSTDVYQHIGPNYSNSGTVWMVGLLVQKSIGSLQTETYTWGKSKISSQNYFRPGAFVNKIDVGETNAPVLMQKAITRDGATYTTAYSGFDMYGNPSAVTETGPNGGNRTTQLTYYVDTTKWIVKQVKNETSADNSVSRGFDANGNLNSVTQNGVTTTHGYDGQGNVSSTTFPLGLTHNYSNYKRGIAQTENQPEGVNLSRVVSDAGNVVSETNGDGKTTTFGYDGLNRVTSIGYPVNSPVTITYGATTKSATRGPLNETTNYDGFGEPISVSLGGISRTFQLDALGRKTFQSNPGDSIGTHYGYDDLNRVTSVSNADGTSRSISFSAAKKSVADERSKSTSYTYRAYGNPDQQLLMQIDAADASSSVTLGRTNDLVSSVTQGGVTRNYSYYSNHYLQTVTNPETGTTTYGRDDAGNMTSRSISGPSGSTGQTTYTYDRQNRLTHVTYPGSTPQVTNTYNNTHKLLSATSTTGTRHFGYDNNGNLSTEDLVVDGLTFSVTYGYNNLDQLSGITYPQSGRVVSYSPDVLGRPTAVSGYASSVTYWPSGQISAINYANGTVSSYGQNNRLWPSSFSTGSFINSIYSYDGVGNLQSINDGVDNTYNRTLTYDNINRLTGVVANAWNGTIAYSGVGNITSQVFGSSNLNYAYDGNNRLSSVSGSGRNVTYGYDANGNISSATGNTYSYDGAPNLVCINCTDPVNKIEYSYDATNHRSIVSKGGVKTYEMYGSNGNQLIEFTPSQANKLVQYIYLGGKRIAQQVSHN